MRLLSPPSFSSVATLSLFALAGSAVIHAQGLTLGAPAYSPANPGSGSISGSGTTVSGNYAFSGGAGATTKAYDTVTAFGAGSAASSVALQTGGSVSNLNLYDDSQATISGGSVGTLTTFYSYQQGFSDTSGYNITSGTVGNISQHSSGYGSISGGTVGDVDLSAASYYSVKANPLNLSISGGTVGSVSVTDQFSGGNVAVSGGNVKSLTQHGGNFSMFGGSLGSLTLGTGPTGSTGVVTPTNALVTGGHVAALDVYGGGPVSYDPNFGDQLSDCIIRGGTFNALNASFYGGYDIYGTGLQLTSAGYITGTLSDGEAINTPFTNIDSFGRTGSQGAGFLHLHNGDPAVPEASTTVSFGLLLMLGLGSLVLAKRRAKTAASSAA